MEGLGRCPDAYYILSDLKLKYPYDPNNTVRVGCTICAIRPVFPWGASVPYRLLKMATTDRELAICIWRASVNAPIYYDRTYFDTFLYFARYRSARLSPHCMIKSLRNEQEEGRRAKTDDIFTTHALLIGEERPIPLQFALILHEGDRVKRGFRQGRSARRQIQSIGTRFLARRRSEVPNRRGRISCNGNGNPTPDVLLAK